jgi:hypothetical protein
MRGWMVGLAAVLACAGACAQQGAGADDVTKAVYVWLDGLDEEKLALGQLPFDSPERTNWTYLPQVRAGLPLKVQTEAQQAGALSVVKAALSSLGFDTVSTIRRLEIVLRDEMKHNPDMRDPDTYYLVVFGKPSDKVWGVRFEGHHISLNFTIADGQIISSTPQFFGSNPNEVRIGTMKGTRVLAPVEDPAREFLGSLDEAQRKVAIGADAAPADILTRFEPVATPPDAAQGIAYSLLRAEQKTLLLKLIEAVAGVQRPGVAGARLAKLKEAGMDEIRFLWLGGTEPGHPNYFRVQGPTFVVEWDNTQDSANHSHLVWRDFAGDFGRDVLKEHYQAAHPMPGALAAAH